MIEPNVMLTHPERHWGCRINDRVTWEGMRALIIQNEVLQIVVLPADQTHKPCG